MGVVQNLSIMLSIIEEEKRLLDEMVDNWNEHDDPCSDPGLQYEKEMEIHHLLTQFKIYVNENIGDCNE